MAAVNALDGSLVITADQVGAQAVAFRLVGAGDITAWTWQAQVWTARTEDGGQLVATCTVDTVALVTMPDGTTGTGTTGYGTVRIAAADAPKLETGHWLEVAQLTPTKQGWFRGQLNVPRRVVT